MHRKKSRLIACLTIFTVVTLGLLLTHLIYINRAMETVDIIRDYLINITSLVIAFIALIIALITYFSIDSVNNITSMEGNVLENPNYSVAYSEMVTDFSHCKDKSDFKNCLLKKVNHELNSKTLTCIQFADYIQNTIDHIIWFAYVDFKDTELKDECAKLILNLENESKRYNLISNGIQYTLNENVKLIKYVLDYQEERSLNKDTVCKLEDIRGKMVQNPISQIIYYNYLGLYYRNKANTLLKQCDSQNKEFSFKYMKSVIYYEYSSEVVAQIKILLNRAHSNFNLANELADTDILWQGYIQYNLARTFIMDYLISINCKDIYKTIEKKAYDYAQTALSVRDEVRFLYRSTECSYLNKMFDQEYTFADSLLNEFKKLTQFVNNKIIIS